MPPGSGSSTPMATIPLSMYTKIIEEICPGSDAKLIEDLMRQEHSTLDGLSRARFKALAKRCEKVAKDPEIAALYKMAAGR